MEKSTASVKMNNESIRKNNFNFLRLLFASLVLVSHAPEIRDGNQSRELLSRLFGTVSFGELAVDGFFILSGSLIVASWRRQPKLWDFLEKRIRRIAPGYMAAFWISVLLLAPLAATNNAAYFSTLPYRHLVATALQLQVPEIPGIFTGEPYPDINNAMWSISYEFRCYILVALIGVATFMHQKGVWLALFIMSLALLPFPDIINKIVRFPGFGRVIGTPDTFVSVFVFFCAGACFTLFREKINLNGKWAAVATLVWV